MFKNFLEGLVSLIYPNNCTLCKKYIPHHYDEILCFDCQETLEVNKPPFCLKCSRHLGYIQNNNFFCRECAHHNHHFDFAWATTFYNDSMKKLIHMFKYQNKTSLRKFFAKLMISFVKTYYVDIHQFDCLTSIPLYKTRLRERGYNQSELLLEALAKEFNCAKSTDNLVRIRPTKNQALLGKKDRFTNIQGAFTIRNPQEFTDKSVLIIDDLLTTGITTSEAARMLKEAGAKKVGVLTLSIAN